LFVFAAMGLLLEIFHGFKVPAYLDVSNQTRRLMWTLAHAHGTLLSFVHLMFGLSVLVAPDVGVQNRPRVSGALIGASLLLPGGFLLGGVVFYGGDPGVGVALVPVGAACLLTALFLLARMRGRDAERDNPPARADASQRRRRD
jgi:hypothetical protein